MFDRQMRLLSPLLLLGSCLMVCTVVLVGDDSDPKFVDGTIVFPLREATDKYPQNLAKDNPAIHTLPDGFAYPEIAPEKAEDFAQYLLESVHTFKLPGIAFAIVQGNTVVTQKTYGLLSQKESSPIDANTLFNVGPATHAITSLLAASLSTVSNPLFDQPASKIYGPFRLNDIHSQRTITLRHLLNMTGGIPDYTDDILDPAWAKPEDVFAVIAQSPIIAQPGQVFNYSQVSVSSAGYLMATLSNPKEDLYPAFIQSVKTRLFMPMGMTHATFSLDQAKASNNYASPHKQIKGKFQVVSRWESAMNPFAPSIGLKANLNDMTHWLMTELQDGIAPNGQRIAPAFAVRERWKPTNVHKDIHSGMGWTRQVYHNTEIISNTGSYDRHTCCIGFMPRYRTGFIVLVNTNGPDALTIIQTMALGLTEIIVES